MEFAPLSTNLALILSAGAGVDGTTTSVNVAKASLGSDTSLFDGSDYATGVVPPITENEWLEAWSAVIETLIKFHWPFFSMFPDLHWKSEQNPAGIGQNTTADARLRIPSVRYLSQFMLNLPEPPDTIGEWTRWLETTVIESMSADAYVPFSDLTCNLYKMYEGNDLPEVVQRLVDTTQGTYGVFDESGSGLRSVKLLSDSVLTQIYAGAGRSRFLPAIGVEGLNTILGLGLSSRALLLFGILWRPDGVSGAVSHITFSDTEYSCLRMAFGGEPPVEGFYLETLRTGVLQNTVTPPTSQLQAPFRSSPLSLLMFLKSIIGYVVPGNISYIPRPDWYIRFPVRQQLYGGTERRVDGQGTIHGWGHYGLNCDGPYDHYDHTEPSFDPRDNGVFPTGHPVASSIADCLTKARAQDGGYSGWDYLSLDGVALSITLTQVETHVQEASSNDWYQGWALDCPDGTTNSTRSLTESWILTSSDIASSGDITLPAGESYLPEIEWAGFSVRDALDKAQGALETLFMLRNGLITKITAYVNVLVDELQASGGTSCIATTTTNDTDAQYGGSYTGWDWADATTAVERTPSRVTPTSMAAGWNASIDALQMGSPYTGTGYSLSDVVSRCSGHNTEIPPSEFAEITNRATEASIKVQGLGPFFYRTVKLWESHGALQEEFDETLNEYEIYQTILQSIKIEDALTAIASAPPTTTGTVENLNVSGSHSSTNVDGGLSESIVAHTNRVITKSTTSQTVAARLTLRAGPIFLKVEYNFTHYQGLTQS